LVSRFVGADGQGRDLGNEIPQNPIAGVRRAGDVAEADDSEELPAVGV